MARNTLLAVGLIAAFLVWTTSAAPAHDNASHDQPPEASDATAKATLPEDVEQKARSYFTDLPVVTQDGTELRFFTDVLKDRVVLVSLFYTNCTGMCPLTNQKLAAVQGLLGPDLGRNIYLISLTIDPEQDTPEVLRKYAAQFGAKDGWLFLTGKTENLTTITDRLGQANRQKETHNPYLMIGNVGIARWSKIPPNALPEVIAERLRLMAEHTTED